MLELDQYGDRIIWRHGQWSLIWTNPTPRKRANYKLSPIQRYY